METKLGLILDANLTEPWLTSSEKQEEVIQILRKARLPLEIRVKSDKVRKLVEPITKVLGIKLRIGSLPMLERAKASLEEYLSSRRDYRYK